MPSAHVLALTPTLYTPVESSPIWTVLYELYTPVASSPILTVLYELFFDLEHVNV